MAKQGNRRKPKNINNNGRGKGTKGLPVSVSPEKYLKERRKREKGGAKNA